MRVVARRYDRSDVPSAIAPFETPGQVFLTVGREYAVHALTVFQGHVSLQVVDDHSYPAWHAAWLFDVVDPSISDDWIVSTLRAEPSLVVGPSFLAHDLESYCNMVLLEPEAVHQFWKRIDSLEAARQEDEGG